MSISDYGIGAYFSVSSPVEGMELGNMSQVYVITVKQKLKQRQKTRFLLECTRYKNERLKQ